MKILILSLFILLCSSCYDISNIEINIVSKINSSTIHGKCVYTIKGKDGKNNILRSNVLLDTCNKFQIGDTVKITKINQTNN